MDGGDEQVLADRYRRWLRVYPRSWRERREEEVLGVLLEAAAAEGRSAPARAEVADLVGHGLATRAGVLIPGPGARAVVASVMVALGAAWVLGVWFVGTSVPDAAVGPGRAVDAAFVAEGAWLVAAFLALARRRALTRWAFSFAVVAALSSAVLGQGRGDGAFLAAVALGALIGGGRVAGWTVIPLASLAAVLCQFGGFGSSLPSPLVALWVALPFLVGAAFVALPARRTVLADGLLAAAALGDGLGLVGLAAGLGSAPWPAVVATLGPHVVLVTALLWWRRFVVRRAGRKVSVGVGRGVGR